MVMKAKETKRYEFEAMDSQQAHEIVRKIVRRFLNCTDLANVDGCVWEAGINFGCSWGRCYLGAVL
jgi:hypothetical protein